MIIAVLLFSMILVLCVYESMSVKRLCKIKSEEIDRCEALYSEDREACIKATNTFLKEWEKKQIKLVLFINHAAVDEISIEATRLPALAENADTGDFYACCSLIRRSLDVMKNDQRITLDSFY